MLEHVKETGDPGVADQAPHVTDGSSSAHFGRIIGITVVAALVLVVFFAPSFVLWRGLDIPDAWFNPEVNRAVDTLPRLSDPFATVQNPSNSTMQWRLLFPLIWYYLGLPTWLFLAMPHVGALVTLGLVAHIALVRTRTLLVALGVTILSGTSAWFFVSTGWLAYFDSWFVLGMLLVSFIGSRMGLALSCLLVPWVDERFVFALPLSIVVRTVYLRIFEQRSDQKLSLDAVWATALCTSYLAFRVLLLSGPDTTSVSISRTIWEDIRVVPLWRFAEGLWSGWRAAWVFVVALPWLLATMRLWFWSFVVVVVTTATALVSLLIAADMSRSMATLLPAMLAGLFLLLRKQTMISRVVFPSVLAANLLLPVSHVIWTFKIPIQSVIAEIDNWRHPPMFLRPEFYTRRSRGLLQQGRTAEALDALATALRLDGDYLLARLDRALLQSRLGHHDAALEDLREAARVRPDDPDVLLIRGIVRRGAGDLHSASEDLSRALQIAMPDWPARQRCVAVLKDLERGRSGAPAGE